MKPHRALFVAAVLAFLSSPVLAASPDGTWSPIPAPPLIGPGIYDPVRDRMIVFEGQRLWTWSRNATRWTFLTNVVPPIAGLRSATYDSGRDRLLVAQSSGNSGVLWALTLGANPQWTLLSTSPAGPGGTSAGFRVFYDPIGDRALLPLLINGSAYEQRLMSYSFSSSTWTSIVPGFNSDVDQAMSIVLDPVRHRLLYTNGTTRSNVEALSLDTNTWSVVTSSSPAGAAKGSNGAVVYDPIGDRLIVTGGDTWAINLSGSPAWAQIVANYSPTSRQRATFVFDPLAHRALFVGGLLADGTIFSDVHALELQGTPAWSALLPTGPGPTARVNASMIDDPVRHRVVLFGGNSNGVVNDLWQLAPGSPDQWTPLVASGAAPLLQSHSAIYDPFGDRMLVFGGLHTTLQGSQSNDLWELSLSGSPAWTQLAPLGPLPAPRNAHSAIYDPVRRRMIVFGGLTPSGALNDVWSLALDGPLQWTPLSPAGSIAARAGHGAIYDPNSDAMLVYGGADQILWSLPLATASQWTAIAASGTPPPTQNGHGGVYDPVLNRWVLSGGNLPNLQALSLVGPPAWTVLAPDGGVPAQRGGHAVAYDGASRQMILFSGISSPDTWSIELSQPPVAVDVSLVSADATSSEVTIEWQLAEEISGIVSIQRGSAGGGWETVAETSPSSDHRVRFTDSSVRPGARYDYRLVLPGNQGTAGSVTIDVPLESALALEYAGANPITSGSPAVWLSLPRAGSARLEVIDLSGRTVFVREVGSLGAGRHRIALAGAARNPGIYFARVRFEGASRVLKMVVAR